MKELVKAIFELNPWDYNRIPNHIKFNVDGLDYYIANVSASEINEEEHYLEIYNSGDAFITYIERLLGYATSYDVSLYPKTKEIEASYIKVTLPKEESELEDFVKYKLPQSREYRELDWYEKDDLYKLLTEYKKRLETGKGLERSDGVRLFNRTIGENSEDTERGTFEIFPVNFGKDYNFFFTVYVTPEFKWTISAIKVDEEGNIDIMPIDAKTPFGDEIPETVSFRSRIVYTTLLFHYPNTTAYYNPVRYNYLVLECLEDRLLFILTKIKESIESLISKGKVITASTEDLGKIAVNILKRSEYLTEEGIDPIPREEFVPIIKEETKNYFQTQN